MDLYTSHHWFLEHWNSQKSVCNIGQQFSRLLDEWIEKIYYFFHFVFFQKNTLSILRCTCAGRINQKIFLGYHINYLSIWPFMCHPWFPTREASKLTFVCFQLQLFSPCVALCSILGAENKLRFELSHRPIISRWRLPDFW